MNQQSKSQHLSHLLQQSDIGSRMTPGRQLPYQQLFLIVLIHVVKGQLKEYEFKNTHISIDQVSWYYLKMHKFLIWSNEKVRRKEEKEC